MDGIGSLRSKLATYGQEHLLDHWDQLDDKQRDLLHREIDNLNLPYIIKCFKECNEDLQKVAQTPDDDLEPVPENVFGSIAKTDPETLKQYESEGLKQIGAGKVAALLLAGGQGTRLGVTYPKGMYDVGLKSHKTLYHLMAQRILKVQEMAAKHTGHQNCVVPWYIMTSEQTREPTEAYFRKHKHFGLQPENVILFEQSTMPCMTFDGKIILEKPHIISKAPDGNGGLYSALAREKILDNMVDRGIEYLHVHCVDNILIRMADPVFIGFCISKNAACGYKVVEKTAPTEPVGVICKLKGKYHVVEYSEISLKTAEKRDVHGKLVFNAGGIANHFFTIDFMKTIVKEKEGCLRHHVAKKKIPYCNNKGELVTPKEVNGIKMEKFIFDIFEFTDAFAVWEVLREDEFSPLKNSDSAGKDSPTTSREAMYDLHHRWILKAGGTFVTSDGSTITDIPSKNISYPENNNLNSSHKGDSEEMPVVCEISPLVSYAGEGLEALVQGKKFTPPVVLWDKENESNTTPE